jgi:hypothetical protein
MSYKLVRSHRLYVSSENRDDNDTTSHFSIEIPNNLISLDDPATQRMKVSLMNFTCDCLWFEINNQNNAFIMTNNATLVPTTIFIPQGNYTFQKLALTISKLYPECICKFIQETNTLLFSFWQDHSMSFINSSSTLGFIDSDSGISGTEIASTRPLKTRANNILYLRLNDVIQANDCINLDNLTTAHAKPSNILCTVPINAVPYSTIFYDNSIYGRDMGMFLSNPRLNRLDITVTDKYGEPLEYMSDWQAQFLVEIFDTEDEAMVDMLDTLRSMDSTLKKMMILKFI